MNSYQWNSAIVHLCHDVIQCVLRPIGGTHHLTDILDHATVAEEVPSHAIHDFVGRAIDDILIDTPWHCF